MTSPTTPEVAKPVWLDVVQVFGQFVWPLLIVALAWLFRREISLLIAAFRRRLMAGAGIKIAGIELENTRVGPVPHTSSVGIRVEPTLFSEMYSEREKTYDQVRRIMLVHKIFKSNEPGQVFDIEVYCIPHKDGSLIGVKEVRYCFGAYGWAGKTFVSVNRFNGFAVTTAAYGPTICVARIEFADGTSASTSRYLDFEMGAFAPVTEDSPHV